MSSLTPWFPPSPLSEPEHDSSLVAGRSLPDVRCPVCGQRTRVEGFTDNIRESGYCATCGSWTRIRQLATVLVEAASVLADRPVSSAVGLAQLPGLRIYNTEAHGSLHGALVPAAGYVASEYFGAEWRSGERHTSGVLHEDLQALSFPDNAFDLVISSDVLEHVPDPYRAHGEILRVLAPGGHHVFTVPYVEGAALDEIRAHLRADGTVEHLLPPLYHDDPVRPDEGALVYTIFGLEMIPRLARLGFETAVYRLYDPGRGLVGPGGVVFDAVKSHIAAPAAAGADGA